MVGGAIPALVVPRFYKESSLNSHREEARKQHRSVSSAAAPASRLLPCLNSCPDFLQRWTIALEV